MPNVVNEILLDNLERDFEKMGSCLVVAFDRLTVAEVEDIRGKFREAGMRYQVVKNRLASKAFAKLGLDLDAALQGKCGVVMAAEEGAIGAAKIVREAIKARRKDPPLVVTGGVVEGEAILGAAAATIADMPDKHTVRAQLAGCINGVARGIAACVQAAAGGGLARAMQAHIDKEGGE